MFMFLTAGEKKEDSQSIVDTLVPGKKNNERKQAMWVAHDPAISIRISGVTRSKEYRFEQIQFWRKKSDTNEEEETYCN